MILLDHARRYPEWMIDDVYKLIHQAALGSEHAVVDESTARSRLENELSTLGAGPDEPLVDPISADGEIIRVHLRPYSGMGYRLTSLLDAFVLTARRYRPSVSRLEGYIQEATLLAEEGGLPLNRASMAAFVSEMRRDGFPAVHHSALFEAAYLPAYRVVARAFLPHEFEMGA